ncbi:MAG: hypothetical protein AAGH43_11330 [Pseudomonadota bacterium]
MKLFLIVLVSLIGTSAFAVAQDYPFAVETRIEAINQAFGVIKLANGMALDDLHKWDNPPRDAQVGDKVRLTYGIDDQLKNVIVAN